MSSDRSELSKHVHYKRTFPDRKSKLHKNVAFTTRFYDKYRSKRCLPLGSCSRVVTRVSSFCLAGKVFSVQSSPIRPVFGPQNIHEITETHCSLSMKEIHASADIPGRFSSVGRNKRGSYQKYSAFNRSPSLPWFYNKRQKILSTSNTGNHVPGFNINSLSMEISLPVAKVHKIPDCCHRLATSPTVTLRHLASLIGLPESSRPAIWRAPLHSRHLQMDLITGLQTNQDCTTLSRHYPFPFRYICNAHLIMYLC